MTLSLDVPVGRVRSLNDRHHNPDGEFVVYWMIAARRVSWNFSLQHAMSIADKYGKPLLVMECLGCRAEWSCRRFHQFVLEGMAANQERFEPTPIRYVPYVEPSPGAAQGLLEQLAQRACAIITDDFPCYFLPRMTAALADRVSIAVEAVDGNGLFPMHATDDVFTTAYSFRRFLQKNLRDHLTEFPLEHPLLSAKRLPGFAADLDDVWKRWPAASPQLLNVDATAIAELPIDQAIGPASFTGGEPAAQDVLRRFLDERLPRYAEHRNDPDKEAASGFSPYLHFGHLSPHQVFSEIVRREEWSLDDLADTTKGSRSGWWGMSDDAESFLDELITWREIGYNMTSHRDDYDQYASLPDWARTTLEEHAADERPDVYSPDELEHSQTHDEIWNAAQRQLVIEGRMHNYLRMLWGKKVLEWSETPEQALELLKDLNNKYAVDGRNPNSYSGIFWVFGRYDRAWGPERPIFGKIRYMSSDNTRRKLKLANYLERYGEQAPAGS